MWVVIVQGQPQTAWFSSHVPHVYDQLGQWEPESRVAQTLSSYPPLSSHTSRRWPWQCLNPSTHINNALTTKRKNNSIVQRNSTCLAYARPLTKQQTNKSTHTTLPFPLLHAGSLSCPTLSCSSKQNTCHFPSRSPLLCQAPTLYMWQSCLFTPSSKPWSLLSVSGEYPEWRVLDQAGSDF